MASLFILNKSCQYSSIGGSVVEFSPATRDTANASIDRHRINSDK